MIIVKLMGGLGNQMFQYAVGRSLAEKNNTELIIDTSFLDNKNSGVTVFRNYELDLFPKVKDKRVEGQITAVPVYESHFHYDERVGNLISDQNLYLIGHWQTHKYFDDVADLIREEFEFPPITKPESLKLKEEILSRNSVMINVRRSDYLTDSLFENIGIDYFNKCINQVSKDIENPKFYVFSDDIEWCRNNFIGQEFFIVDHSYAGDRFIDYLNLMSSCKHDIIPNSTFAWWSAWLNKNPNKIVMYPSKWFTDANKNPKDLFLDDWIKV